MKNTLLKHLARFSLVFFLAATLGFIFLTRSSGPAAQPHGDRPNILFIPVDDLRPELGAYGNRVIKTPYIDRLAADGVIFTRAYCQQALCNPSRASLLTGRRPDEIRVWDLEVHFREHLPDAITLPQFFKNNGYYTVGYGKTFHSSLPDSVSWHEEPNRVRPPAQQGNVLPGQAKRGPSLDSADVDDEFYRDGEQTTQAIRKLRELKDKQQPFFLSVGFHKPHLPFVAPKKYWDLYKRAEIPVASNQFVPEGSPVFAVHGDSELRQYADRRDLPKPDGTPYGLEKQREQVHAYYACVSYVDAQIGRLLDELERLGLRENTIVVLWGDHGWKLGEHNSWGKMSNYETDTNAPLIFSGKGVKAKGRKSAALTEFVDIYPTLLDLAGFEIPGYLQGASLAPLLEDPDKAWKTAAFSQYLLGRFGTDEYRRQERMGYAIRTDQYRYVAWYEWDKKGKKRGAFLAAELFDHKRDPEENINLAGRSDYRETEARLAIQLESGWKSHLPPAD